MASLSDLVWMLTEASNDESDCEVIASEIGMMSGYPLAALVSQPQPPAAPVCEVSSAAKRRLLQDLQPYMAAMNQNKSEETDLVLSATGFRSSREQASGLYVYTSKAGRVVAPSDFERLYGGFVERRRVERWAATTLDLQDWFSDGAPSADVPEAPACRNDVDAEVVEAAPAAATEPVGSDSGPEWGQSTVQPCVPRARKTLSPSQVTHLTNTPCPVSEYLCYCLLII